MAEWKKQFGKRGMSLVEDICAAAVLVLAVAAILGTIGFSRSSVWSSNTSDGAAARAQSTADSLITVLSSATSSAPADLSDLGKDVTDTGFSYASGGECQYTLSDQEEGGRRITVRVYYNGGKNYVQMSAYASDTGGVFRS